MRPGDAGPVLGLLRRVTPMGARGIVNVLFLCTGNSARSIIAEALLNREGGGRFRAFSAGSRPKGTVHPMALEVLRAYGFPTDGLRSKSWDELAPPDAPSMDLVITVCDSAAGEACPVWPGRPVTAHWGLDDPAAIEGEGQRAAFERTLLRLGARVSALTLLPLESCDAKELRRRLAVIGGMEGSTT